MKRPTRGLERLGECPVDKDTKVDSTDKSTVRCVYVNKEIELWMTFVRRPLVRVVSFFV